MRTSEAHLLLSVRWIFSLLLQNPRESSASVVEAMDFGGGLGFVTRARDCEVLVEVVSPSPSFPTSCFCKG